MVGRVFARVSVFGAPVGVLVGVHIKNHSRSQLLSDAMRVARREAEEGGDWVVELIKLVGKRGIPVMRKFFWEGLRYMAIYANCSCTFHYKNRGPCRFHSAPPE